MSKTTTMSKKIILCCMVPVIVGVFFRGQCEANEITEIFLDEAGISATEIAQKAGYEAESYEVVTEDGYILRLDRITGSTKSPPSDNKTPVLLVHGLLDASPTWLVAGPEFGLGFILADQGYDVWLGNVRGNRYSRKNLHLTTSDPNFWMFSWHEIGIYDFPAMIDHIIEQTKQEKILMITHSQGGTAFFVMASERPEYQEKVFALSALAPAVFMSRAGSTLLKVLCLVAANGNSILNLLGIYQVNSSSILVPTIGKVLCPKQSPLLPLCEGVLDVFYGYDGNFNTNALLPVSQYSPAGASVKQFAHYGQSIQSGKFRKFDYGAAGNMKKYGQEQPPEYNLGNVSIPVDLYYGTNDVIATPPDIQELYETLTLPNGQKSLIQIDNFAHLDFLWGNDVKSLVYNKILNFMEQHGN